MKKIVFLVISVVFLAANVFAQGDEKANGFHGLMLGTTTAEDAAKVLGTPATDRLDRLDVSRLSKWLDPKVKEKIFRQLTFKNIGDFSQIQLSFLENKLVMIQLEFKKNITYDRLDGIFGVEFALIGGQTGASDLPNEPGKYPVRFIPTAYPFSYSLIGISEHAFIWVDCSTGDVARPGRVDKTRQVSRTLQKSEVLAPSTSFLEESHVSISLNFKFNSHRSYLWFHFCPASNCDDVGCRSVVL